MDISPIFQFFQSRIGNVLYTMTKNGFLSFFNFKFESFVVVEPINYIKWHVKSSKTISVASPTSINLKHWGFLYMQLHRPRAASAFRPRESTVVVTGPQCCSVLLSLSVPILASLLEEKKWYWLPNDSEQHWQLTPWHSKGPSSSTEMTQFTLITAYRFSPF